MEEKGTARGGGTRQVLQSILGGLLGASTGVLAWFLFDEGSPWFIPYLIGTLGCGAGVGLTVPGVSARRVGKGVVAGILAKPLGPFAHVAFEAVLKEGEEEPPEPSSLETEGRAGPSGQKMRQ